MAPEFQFTDLRYTINQLCYLRSERILDFIDRDIRVFYHIMEKPRSHGDDVHTQFCEDFSRLQTVFDIRSPGFSELELVGIVGKIVGFSQEIDIGIFTVGLDST